MAVAHANKRAHYFKDWTGARFGNLVVIEFAEISKGMVIWNCQCDCGNARRVDTSSLTRTRSPRRSCGCARDDRNATQGRLSVRNPQLYATYRNMISRCGNPKNAAFLHYGGRGITVCEEWKSSASSFEAWAIANNWAAGLEIDRIDNNKGYSPSNCRIVTVTVNANNKRSNIRLEAYGERKTMSEWSRDSRCVVDYNTLWFRIHHTKWPVELAISQVADRANCLARNRFK